MVTSGVGRGSILELYIGNAFDKILRKETPEDTYLFGYADDIATVIKVRRMDEAQRSLHDIHIKAKAAVITTQVDW